MDITGFVTLEELFHNGEALTPKDAMSWVRFKYPELEPSQVGEEAEIVLGLYGLWEKDLIFVEGDVVGFHG